jgi:hypothetical protein
MKSLSDIDVVTLATGCAQALPVDSALRELALAGSEVAAVYWSALEAARAYSHAKVPPATHRAQAAPSSTGMQRLGVDDYLAQRRR